MQQNGMNLHHTPANVSVRPIMSLFQWSVITTRLLASAKWGFWSYQTFLNVNILFSDLKSNKHAGNFSTLFSVWPNLALNKPALSSSNWQDGISSPSKVVDGNVNTNYNSGSCFSSGTGDLAGNAWWAVDLGIAYYIRYVVLTNRGNLVGKCSLLYSLSRVVKYTSDVIWHVLVLSI